MSWVALQLISMLLMSINSVLDKHLMKNSRSSPVLQLGSFALVGLPVMLIGSWLVPWPGIMISGLGLLSGLVFSIAVILYYQALILEDVSRLIPILRLSGAFQLTLLALVLNDKLSPLQYLAFISMLVGSFAMAWKPRQNNSVGGKWAPISRGILIMMLAAFLLAFNSVLESHLILDYSPWVLIIWSNAGTVVGFSLLLVSSRHRATLFSQVISIPTNSRFLIIFQQLIRLIFGTLAELAIYEAGSSAITTVLGGLRPLLVLVLALLFLDERLTRQEVPAKLLGVILLSIGTWFIFIS
jgi:drug/metabolite transporter (DMT)-like permease